ncbi:hypothetical protein QR680_016253 [Steinernema hermaphroditum]|uniref:Uncharacterized protein n=1 Tax=Steinernema hermaphroditum TaxID=289476 RepID=A0AA39HAK8_9BILA|nr:hypothetical protein QR680_016253 [Steinernema hermaphroditum]
MKSRTSCDCVTWHSRYLKYGYVRTGTFVSDLTNLIHKIEALKLMWLELQMMSQIFPSVKWELLNYEL